MPRLIDADAIEYESIDSCDTGRYERYYGTGIIAVRKEDIDEMPTIEPERKKGKWVGKEQFANSPEFYSWQCSVCGCVLEDPTLDKPYTFCPNCGADMRGDRQ